MIEIQHTENLEYTMKFKEQLKSYPLFICIERESLPAKRVSLSLFQRPECSGIVLHTVLKSFHSKPYEHFAGWH